MNINGHDVKAPCIVVSQPMYFPWIGLLEQVRLCDVFVYYDDVQFVRGFFNRVQVKTASGTRWLTVPLRKRHRGQLIGDVQIDHRRNWRRSHLDMLRQAYVDAPYRREMLQLVNSVFTQEILNLAELAKASTVALVEYFGIGRDKAFHDASALGIPGHGTQRLIELCLHFHAATYLTGHGARNYLQHERFEDRGLEVAYIDYGLRRYPQEHGEFTPYVTALDLVAHCGRDGAAWITGSPMPWRAFLATRQDGEKFA